MAKTAFARLIGKSQLLKKLDALDKKMRNKVARKATTAGARIVVQAVKAEVPVDEGVVRRAETSKIVGKGTQSTAFIGADIAKMTTETNGQARPSNIDSLIEYGFQSEAGSTVAGKYPLRRGYESSKEAAAKAMQSVLASELKNAI